MDVNQITQMVSWLDEERRRDRKVIEELQQKVEAQSHQLEQNAHFIKTLEGHLANLRSQLVDQDRFVETQQQLRKDIALQMERFEAELNQRLQDVQHLYRSYQDNNSRVINELRKELNRVSLLQEEVNLRKAEDQRLGQQLAQLKQSSEQFNKEIGEKIRSLPYLIEQRHQDHQRTAQLQEENVEIFRRLEEMRGRLSGAELRITRQEATNDDMKTLVVDLRRQMAKFQDDYQMRLSQRQKVEAVWQENLSDMMAKFEAYSQQHQEMQITAQRAEAAIKDIKRWQEVLRRDQDQVAELQRLAEERHKGMIEEYQSEVEKRLQRQALQQQQFEDEQERKRSALVESIQVLRDVVALHEEHLKQLWKLQEAIMEQRMRAARTETDVINKALGTRLESEKKAARS